MTTTLDRKATPQPVLARAKARGECFECSGQQPAATAASTLNHNLIAGQVFGLLRERLSGTGCQPFLLDAAITIPDGAPYTPDVAVTCSNFAGTARTIPAPVVVMEVVTPASARLDRLVKVGEYATIPSLCRYVIIESTMIGLTILSRPPGKPSWTAIATALEGGILPMPEIGTELSVSDIYEGIAFSTPGNETPPHMPRC